MNFEVEVAGCPLPELTWFHNDRKVKEGKEIQVPLVMIETNLFRCDTCRTTNVNLLSTTQPWPTWELIR